MINFIINTNSKCIKDMYISYITSYIGEKREKYKILTLDNNINFNSITNKIDGNKIFLLDNEKSFNHDINFAKNIRNSGDWLSPIIIFTNLDNFKAYCNTSKILMIDFIVKDKYLKKNFMESIRTAHSIVKIHKSYVFNLDGEIYSIPYNDILYFQKSTNSNYCKIVTNNNEYEVRDSLLQIEKKLDNDCRFMKTHRSYIINIHNIYKINLCLNTVVFKNGSTALISRDKKKDIKDCLETLMID